MVARQVLNIASFKTASRCWIPVKKAPTLRHFSSRQRLVNFNNANDARMVANDKVFTIQKEEPLEHEHFEPTVFSSEEIHTPGPVNKV